jgi:ribosomal protein S18 acetylase RimI-like enzyme
VSVRIVTAIDELDAAGRTLGAAFHDDPVFAAFIPPSVPRRHDRLSLLFAAQARTAARHGEVWVTAGAEAAAVWLAPGRWKATPSVILREAIPAARAMRRRVVLGLRAQAAVEKVHPDEPHWYLHGLGTDPAHQGRGLGSSLLAPVLDRCDDEGVPAYLESSKHSNIPFYERHGFRVRDELAIPGGVTVWPMWRDPGGRG